MKIPTPVPAAMPAGYSHADETQKLLDWDYVSQRMTASKNYWIATINPNGRPHVVPVWGVWVDDTLYFGGSPETWWAKNLKQRPYVTVHLDDSDKAIILEGTVTLIDDPKSDIMTRIDDAYEPKYNMRHGPPIWHLHLKKVIAWQSMNTTTRWIFDNQS